MEKLDQLLENVGKAMYGIHAGDVVFITSIAIDERFSAKHAKLASWLHASMKLRHQQINTEEKDEVEFLNPNAETWSAEDIVMTLTGLRWIREYSRKSPGVQRLTGAAEDYFLTHVCARLLAAEDWKKKSPEMN